MLAAAHCVRPLGPPYVEGCDLLFALRTDTADAFARATDEAGQPKNVVL
jgi:hypothetical protein